MGKKKTAAILLFFLANRVVMADLVPLTSHCAARPAASRASTLSTVPHDQADVLREPLILELTSAALTYGLPACPAIADTHRSVGMTPSDHGVPLATESTSAVEVPPPPSSGTLTLSGLLTLGAMQLARSARRAQFASFLHIGHLPDWYDADAGQIGHSVPFEFQLSVQLLSAAFSRITPEPECAHPGDLQPDASGCIRSPQQSLLAMIPRGPPRLRSH